MADIKLHVTPKIRDNKLDFSVHKSWQLITQPRFIVEQSMKEYDSLVANYGDDFLNEFNLPKEELEKMITAYKALLAATPDLC